MAVREAEGEVPPRAMAKIGQGKSRIGAIDRHTAPQDRRIVEFWSAEMSLKPPANPKKYWLNLSET